MTFDEVMHELEAKGDAQTKKTLIRHGAKEPCFGVKVQELKKILKKTKKNHALSLALYATGNSDAMYLAGLMADENQISKAELQEWVKQAYWHYISEYTVPWVAAESPYGLQLGLEWIVSSEENIAAAGWATIAYYASVREDEDLDNDIYRQLLDRIGNSIHDAQNRVRYVMNGFVIAIGTYMPQLTDYAKEVAEKIGKVSVDVGDTACKVPLATAYIDKVIDKDRVGKKRKTARC